MKSLISAVITIGRYVISSPNRGAARFPAGHESYYRSRQGNRGRGAGNKTIVFGILKR